MVHNFGVSFFKDFGVLISKYSLKNACDNFALDLNMSLQIGYYCKYWSKNALELLFAEDFSLINFVHLHFSSQLQKSAMSLSEVRGHIF